jgi:hypothetical protein
VNLNKIEPKKALNKAFLKVKPSRDEIEKFKANLVTMLDQINEKESEEFHKNIISEFLKNTYYGNNHYINTKGRYDLVIHNGKDSGSTVGVIIETKSPKNKNEMLSTSDLNAKAFHELIFYFLQERLNNKNLEIRYLIAANIYEWFIFDAGLFDENFAKNKELVKLFTQYSQGSLSGSTVDFFYKNIAGPVTVALESTLSFTHFDIRDYEKALRNADKKDDDKLAALYKLLSPVHLLKMPYANDSNSLDKGFYTELLHLIGLVETKEGSKKLIERPEPGRRSSASLIENAIEQLDSLQKVSRLDNPARYGGNEQEILFNVALELAITWINRILFLKLLEAQLIAYHKGNRSYAFLNSDMVKNFDDLNSLFFSVLARKANERSSAVKKLFTHVPYLNSSLFEPTELEHSCLFISQLKDAKLPLIFTTVLKDNAGKRKTGELPIMEYFFEFLNAYDFSGESDSEIAEENKTLINASVLGLIFEKINGYKDGSFFTPGFITMYMCRETIRRAVVQKFNDAKGWKCTDFNELYDKIEDRGEANRIINSLKICDPAVGSGHFLVSALNEIIAVKSELKILSDREGKRLKEYQVEVVNDELMITDEDGEFFKYNPNSAESRRVQEALFHEKQTIIESCLFGVDINPNSVKICRLRLWIELLKSAYYKTGDNELETLPNIDINIKCGNSLISRFALDADIKQALKKSKWTIDSYRLAVMAYRNAASKEEKWGLVKLIEEIKRDFRSEVSRNDKRKIRLDNLKAELTALLQEGYLFEMSKAEKESKEKKVKSMLAAIEILELELEEVRSSKIYENAFEWRFEFPEVLNDDGDFVGFDVVIGNPPYGVAFNSYDKQMLSSEYFTIDDIYAMFIEKGFKISNKVGYLSLIIPIFWLTGDKYKSTRKLVLKHAHLEKGIILPYNIFADAYVDTGIYIFSKNREAISSLVYEFEPKDKIDNTILDSLSFNELFDDEWKNTDDLKIVFNPVSRSLLSKLGTLDIKIADITDSVRGILANLEDYSEVQLNQEYKPIFTGKLDRYCLDNAFSYLKYGENLLEKPSSSRFFEGERVLIRRIVSRKFRIMATIATSDFVNKKDIYVFKLKTSEISHKYMLAIINSCLISFIKTKASTTAKKDDFTQLTLNDIRQLGIPVPQQQQQSAIERLVTQILAAKKDNPDADTAALEKEIDRLVYQLYGLTEIKIVEGE